MRKLFLYLLINFLIIFQSNSQQIISYNTSNINSCDGSALFTDTNTAISWLWTNIDNSTNFGENLSFVNNLCIGNYALTYTDTNFLTSEVLFNISSSECDSFQIYVQSINPSNNNTNDGAIYANVNGNNSGLTFLWNTGETSSSITNLTIGEYSVCAFNNQQCESCIDIVLLADSTLNPCENFYIETNTTPVSNANSCDGIVEFIPQNGTNPITYNINGISYNQSFIQNLCPNIYSFTAVDANSCTFTFTFTIGIVEDTSTVFTANAIITNISQTGQCDGSVLYQINGGIAPYTIINNQGLQVDIFETNLCEGVYSTIINDSEGSQIILTYIIASPEQIINNNFFPDSSIIGTLDNGLIENCDLIFSSIDTAFLSQVEIISLDSLIATWNIVDINGLTQIVQNYSLENGFGVYQLILQIFCPQRAQDDYLIIKEQFKLINWINAVDKNKITKGIKIYPNPFDDFFKIFVENSYNTNIQITDIHGKLVFSDNYTTEMILVSSYEWEKGIYFVKIQNENTNETIKLIKD